jgi:acetate---CoA ligase (ADP-forming)
MRDDGAAGSAMAAQADRGSTRLVSEYRGPASAGDVFEARSVAIVGDSATGKGRGAVFRERLLATGYDGRVIPVNPRYESIAGLATYASVADIPGGVDLVACALPASKAIAVTHDAISASAKAIIVLASGFAETGEDGRAMQTELGRLAIANGITLLGPNSLGAVDLAKKRQFYFGDLPRSLRAGNIALVFQSGALLETVTESFVRRGIGVSHIVSTGNEAATSVSDYLELLADEEAAQVLICLVETLRDPPRLREAVSKAQLSGKSVIVLHNGVSELGRKAAASHTGTLVGDARAYRALFRSLGAVQVRDIEELVEAAALLTTAAGRRVIGRASRSLMVVSHSGGACELLVDLAADCGLPMATLSDSGRRSLGGLLPSFANIDNPLDITAAGGLDAAMRDSVLEVLGRESGIGAVVYGLTSADVAEAADPAIYPQPVFDSMIDASGASDVPLVPVALTALQVEPALSTALVAAGTPLLAGARSALGAISAVMAARPRPGRLADGVSDYPLPAHVAKTLAAQDAIIGERQTKELLRIIGVSCVPEVMTRSEAEAHDAAALLGWPVVLKLEATGLIHKSDVGGVRVGIRSPEELTYAYRQIHESAARIIHERDIVGIAVQPMIEDGIDVIVGLSWDPDVGMLVACGMGGVLAEAINDIAVRCAPVTADDVLDMVAELRYSKLMRDGFRHLPPGDVAALADAVSVLSRFGHAAGAVIQAVDINPLRMREPGRGAIALDASMITGGGLQSSAAPLQRSAGS